MFSNTSLIVLNQVMVYSKYMANIVNATTSPVTDMKASCVVDHLIPTDVTVENVCAKNPGLVPLATVQLRRTHALLQITQKFVQATETACVVLASAQALKK